MSLSNNSTPEQSSEIVDPEGSCKKDNHRPINNCIGPDCYCSLHTYGCELNSSSKGSQKTVNILNNKIQVNIELVKGEKKKLVRYDGSYRNEYTFISPLTGKRWWITPKGYSSHFKSEHWNANWVDGSHGTYQNITRNCGT